MNSNETDSGATAEAQAHKEIIACGECGYQWSTQSEMERVTCPNCQHKTKRNVVELRRSERARSCNGASSIGEMAKRHEQRADHLRALSDKGWELDDDTVRGDYTHLTYDLTEVGENGN